MSKKISGLGLVKSSYVRKFDAVFDFNNQENRSANILQSNKAAYEPLCADVGVKLIAFVGSIDALIATLEDKLNDLSKSQDYDGDEILRTYSELAKSATLLNENIQKNKDDNDKIDVSQKSARDALKDHYVYEFVSSDDYKNKLEDVKKSLKSKIISTNELLKNKCEEFKKRCEEFKPQVDNFNFTSISVPDGNFDFITNKCTDNDVSDCKALSDVSINVKKNVEAMFGGDPVGHGSEDKGIIGKIDDTLREIKREINESSFDVKAINKNINRILGNKNFTIGTYESNKNSDAELIDKITYYCILRNGKKPNNANKEFSEGEKTAIAFSCFLAMLKSGKSNEQVASEDIIAVIDDPICSLDHNIIYNIYSQILDNVIGKVSQVFILTHNYEFMALVTRFLLGHKGKETRETRLFLMNGGSLSQLGGDIFQDRYALLCYYVNKFIKSDEVNAIELNFTIGNVCRKLVETFCKFKTNQDYITNNKIANLIDANGGCGLSEGDLNAINRFVNNNSHAGIYVDSEASVSSVKEIVKNILKVIEHVDKSHYDAHFAPKAGKQ